MANVTPGDSQYIALTTYRRDGHPVTTPVWAVPLEGKLYVVTRKAPARPAGGAPQAGCASPRAI